MLMPIASIACKVDSYSPLPLQPLQMLYVETGIDPLPSASDGGCDSMFIMRLLPSEKNHN
jgi:hypothetical protein